MLKEKIERIREIGISTGDYVRQHRTYCGVWQQVTNAHLNKGKLDWKWVSVAQKNDKDYLLPLDNILAIHRKNDPWNFSECNSIHLADKSYVVSPSNLDSAPDKYFYQGTFKIKLWGWIYRGRLVTPDKEKRIDDWLDLHGFANSNIPYDKVYKMIETLKTKCIDGWFPSCIADPEQTFDKTIYVP